VNLKRTNKAQFNEEKTVVSYAFVVFIYKKRNLIRDFRALVLEMSASEVPDYTLSMQAPLDLRKSQAF